MQDRWRTQKDDELVEEISFRLAQKSIDKKHRPDPICGLAGVFIKRKKQWQEEVIM